MLIVLLRKAGHFRGRVLVWLLAVALVTIACFGDRTTEPSAGRPSYTAGSLTCTTGCRDNFTDAEDTPLAGHVADVGGFTWSPVPGWHNDARILGNAVGVKGADTLDQDFHFQVPEIVGLDSVETEVELIGDAVTMAGTYVTFITLRGDGTIMGGYRAWFRIHASARVASVGFDRNNEPLPLAGSDKAVPYPSQGVHKFRAEASGGTLKAYLDGVLVNQVTDPSPLPAGHPGFGLTVLISGYGNDSQVRITSFEVKPCPPTSDPVLDDPDVKRDLEAELVASRGNGGALTKQEHTGWIYQWQNTQDYFVHPEQDPGATDCGNTIRAPQGVSGAVPVRPYHTHPSYNGETLFGCGGGPQIADRSPQWGGGSVKDWAAAQSGSMYVVSYDKLGQPGKVYRLDPSLASSKKLWGTNPNKWQFDSNRCLQKLP
jgi:hypothetical protein